MKNRVAILNFTRTYKCPKCNTGGIKVEPTNESDKVEEKYLGEAENDFGLFEIAEAMESKRINLKAVCPHCGFHIEFATDILIDNIKKSRIQDLREWIKESKYIEEYED